jgi:hypothetical protein
MLEVLSFIFYVELGYIPQSEVFTYVAPELECIDENHLFYTDLGATVFFWDILYIGGSVKTYVWPMGFGEWSPNKADYLFKVGARFYLVEIGFRHWCKHPVIPHLYRHDNFNTIDEVHEELFLKLEGRVGK